MIVRAGRVFATGFALTAAVLAAACSPSKPIFKGADVTGVPWGGDVSLTSHQGTPQKLSDFTGKVVVIFFGFTHCPDICTPTLAKLSAALRQLGDKAREVQVVFITVDPDHDSPAVLAKFVPAFHPSFIGLTGSAGQIFAAQREFKIIAEGQGEGTIMHSGNVMLKGRDGRLRVILKNDAPVADIVHDISVLLENS